MSSPIVSHNRLGRWSSDDSEKSEKTVLDYAKEASKKEVQAQAEQPATKGPPLPFHTIEGYGGGALTPMAYLVNPARRATSSACPRRRFPT